MDEEKRPRESDRPDRSQLTGIENFYENFRKVPLKYLDLFIGLCVAALVLVIALGILNR
ncbi:hypothetical protein [Pseudoflavonifractor sp. 60]|uniref:hypothetical protein n=1 Tax=Pseudoflavonifractor sp. 60 TaxID=2304576 RepID=UPI0013707124|nr:hypothetical protein [Pseudoflavonifractor sp. 60]